MAKAGALRESEFDLPPLHRPSAFLSDSMKAGKHPIPMKAASSSSIGSFEALVDAKGSI